MHHNPIENPGRRRSRQQNQPDRLGFAGVVQKYGQRKQYGHGHQRRQPEFGGEPEIQRIVQTDEPAQPPFRREADAADRQRQPHREIFAENQQFADLDPIAADSEFVIDSDQDRQRPEQIENLTRLSLRQQPQQRQRRKGQRPQIAAENRRRIQRLKRHAKRHPCDQRPRQQPDRQHYRKKQHLTDIIPQRRIRPAQILKRHPVRHQPEWSPPDQHRRRQQCHTHRKSGFPELRLHRQRPAEEEHRKYEIQNDQEAAGEKPHRQQRRTDDPRRIPVGLPDAELKEQQLRRQ